MWSYVQCERLKIWPETRLIHKTISRKANFDLKQGIYFHLKQLFSSFEQRLK